MSVFRESVHSTVPGGSCGFYPQFKFEDKTNDASVQFVQSQGSDTLAYATLIHLSAPQSALYAQERYIPTEKLDPWLFVLWDSNRKTIVGTWYAPDHPSYGQSGNEFEIPHPFSDFWDVTDIMNKHKIPNGMELILVDLEQTRGLEQRATLNRTVSEIVHEEYTVDESQILTYTKRAIAIKDRISQSRVVERIPTYLTVRALKQRPQIHVVQPNGGEIWQLGTPQLITWTDDIAEDVVIELYQNNVFIKEIVTFSSVGFYVWVPDAAPGGGYTIKIKSTLSEMVMDSSDASFTLQ